MWVKEEGPAMETEGYIRGGRKKIKRTEAKGSKTLLEEDKVNSVNAAETKCRKPVMLNSVGHW